MGIATTVQEMLERRSVAYDCVAHSRTSNAAETAEVCRIPEDNLAKGVLLKRRSGYLLAIVPASCQVRLEAVGDWLDEPVGLASERDIERIFNDCEIGSVPPIAGAYGLAAVMDEKLEGFSDIYFECGDHRTLIHMSGRDFHRLTAEVPHAPISIRSH